MDYNAVFLVVDDFDPMRKVTVNQLRSMGLQNILTANNGAEALRVIRHQKVDVVLSDWNMPVMSGLELFRSLRRDGPLSEIPFVLITAEAERRQIQEAISAGVTELIVKPYSPKRLLSQIEKVLSPGYKNSMRAAALVHSAESTLDPAQPISPASQPLADAAPEGAAGQTVGTTVASSLPDVRDLPRLLIVDDVPDNLMLLSNLFRGEYVIRPAKNGVKALEHCQGDSPPDLVLLDVMMPGISGFEVLQRMREHPTSENIPVIFITAKSEETDRSLGLELGAVDYITKPIDPATLKLRVRNFMHFVSMRRQLQASFDDMMELSRLREHVERITRHDTKGPIAAAMGLVQEIIDEGCEHADDLGVVMQALDSALEAASLASDLFKIESGNYLLHPEAVPILPLIEEVVKTHRSLWQPLRIRNRVQAPDTPQQSFHPELLGEPALCRLILQNLLKNAWEASPPDADVLMSWDVVGEEWTLRITNSGTIPQAIRHRFFDKYVTSGKKGGTGLGTYSARLLTEVQMGRLSFELDEARNTTTLIWFMPVAPSRRSSAEQKDGPLS